MLVTKKKCFSILLLAECLFLAVTFLTGLIFASMTGANADMNENACLEQNPSPMICQRL
jgi:hypothetical protein